MWFLLSAVRGHFNIHTGLQAVIQEVRVMFALYVVHAGENLLT